VLPQFTHNMPEYWPNPARFDPERFAEHRREDKVHRYAWSPFGGGAHKCIGMYFGGMEVKAIFHQVLQRYRWSVEPGYETTFDFTRLPVPADGLPVRLDRIDQEARR
jgi:cytochrome P450